MNGERLGVLLRPMIGVNNLEATACRCSCSTGRSASPEDFGRLIGEVSPSLSDGRPPLYVCAECGTSAGAR